MTPEAASLPPSAKRNPQLRIVVAFSPATSGRGSIAAAPRGVFDATATAAIVVIRDAARLEADTFSPDSRGLLSILMNLLERRRTQSQLSGANKLIWRQSRRD